MSVVLDLEANVGLYFDSKVSQCNNGFLSHLNVFTDVLLAYLPNLSVSVWWCVIKYPIVVGTTAGDENVTVRDNNKNYFK